MRPNELPNIIPITRIAPGVSSGTNPLFIVMMNLVVKSIPASMAVAKSELLARVLT